uniref:Uncharacterized protein n=1 Tax=Arundo donax TaxID=35708 RepID=A0A0A9E3Z5_ARUDO
MKMGTPKTAPQRLLEGEDLDVMKLLQGTAESLLDPNENKQQDFENLLQLSQQPENLVKFHMHNQKLPLLKRMLSVQA